MDGVGGLDTLFDELVVGQIMDITGADEGTARFALALHRGSVSGDVHIEGREFRGTPIFEAPARVRFAAPWRWCFATGSHWREAPTAVISFASDYERVPS